MGAPKAVQGSRMVDGSIDQCSRSKLIWASSGCLWRDCGLLALSGLVDHISSLDKDSGARSLDKKAA